MKSTGEKSLCHVHGFWPWNRLLIEIRRASVGHSAGLNVFLRVGVCELNENFFWSSLPRTDC
jgi:hypothetical protein